MTDDTEATDLPSGSPTLRNLRTLRHRHGSPQLAAAPVDETAGHTAANPPPGRLRRGRPPPTPRPRFSPHRGHGRLRRPPLPPPTAPTGHGADAAPHCPYRSRPPLPPAAASDRHPATPAALAAQLRRPRRPGPGGANGWGSPSSPPSSGAAVGAGVTALADNGNGGNSLTIHESNSTPGAAVLSGNVTIPQLVKKVIPAVVSIDVKSHGNEDEGTGMIITSSGEVVTNNHVIELYTDGGETGTITVTEYGQKKSEPTTLIGYNSQQDVALLKINNPSANLPTVTFGSSSKAVVGDSVVAIGNALGLAAGTPTVTQGIVSALGRSVSAGGDGTATENLQNLIQTDAAINPGNSGGPLIDTAGQVIGMNTAVAGSSEDGTDAQNIGFAIPIDEVEALLPQLEKGGPASNAGGYLGVDITTLTPALREQYGFTPTSGVVVLDVVSGSPAKQGRLRARRRDRRRGRHRGELRRQPAEHHRKGQAGAERADHLLPRGHQAHRHGDAREPGRGAAAGRVRRRQ